MLFFSVGNGAYERSTILVMAQRTPPQYWQWRNEHLRDIGNGAMNSPAILETATLPSPLLPPPSSPPPFPCLVAMLRPVRIHWGLYKENGKPQFSL
jgi:hypothetical protein